MPPSTTYISVATSTAAPYQPASDWGSNEQYWFQGSVNVGIYVGTAMLGLHTATAFAAASKIWKGKTPSRFGWLPLVAVMWIMGVVNIACNITLDQSSWFDGVSVISGYISGITYTVTYHNAPASLAAVSTIFVNLILADGFLLFRAHTYWKKWYITAPLTVAWLVEIAFVAAQCAINNAPYSSFWVGAGSGIDIPGVAVSGALRSLLGILILARILFLRRAVASTLPPMDGSTLSTFQAAVVESALPYGIISLVYMILYCIGLTAANYFLPLIVQLQGIIINCILMRERGPKAQEVTTRTIYADVLPIIAVELPLSEHVSAATIPSSIYSAENTSKRSLQEKSLPPAYVV